MTDKTKPWRKPGFLISSGVRKKYVVCGRSPVVFHGIESTFIETGSSRFIGYIGFDEAGLSRDIGVSKMGIECTNPKL